MGEFSPTKGPLSVELKASGAIRVAWEQNALPIFQRVCRRHMPDVLGEWLNKRSLPGLGGRFSEANAGRLGFTKRKKNYRERQRRVLGKEHPYVSPTRNGTRRAGHMRDLIRGEGTGWRVTLKRTDTGMEANIKLPGARILNRIKGEAGRTYRREFLRLAHPVYGREDRDWIQNELARRVMPDFLREMARQERATLRARRGLSRLITESAPPALPSTEDVPSGGLPHDDMLG